MTTTYPASQKQFDFLKRLIGEKQLDEAAEVVIARYREKAVEGTLTSREASSLIDALKQYPRKADEQASSTNEPEAGIYVVHGDQYVRVYLGQQSGRMLAKRIHMEQDTMGDWAVSYEYLGAAAKVLVPSATPQRLSLEEVGSFGITTNHCLICGHRLDVPESVDRGVGPVCAEKY